MKRLYMGDKTKKICIFCGSVGNMGGEQIINVMLANHLAQNPDYEIEILPLFTPNPPIFKIDPRIKIGRIFGKPFNLKRHMFKFVSGMRKAVRGRDFDLYIVSGMGIYPAIKMFAKKSAKMICWHHQPFSAGKKFGLEWTGKHLAARFSEISVVQARESLEAASRLAADKSSVRLIPNGIDLSGMDNCEYDASSKKIISCGRLWAEKGFDMLVDVADKVLGAHKDWEWHIYGDGPERRNLKDMIGAKKLADRLFLKGFSNKLDCVYPEYAMYVMTSRFEGFGLVLVEAQKHRLPCVAFDTGTQGEIISDGKNGFLIESFDKDKMAEKICELIENRGLREKFAGEAHDKIRKFSLENFYRSWDNLVAEVVGRKS